MQKVRLTTYNIFVILTLNRILECHSLTGYKTLQKVLEKLVLIQQIFQYKKMKKTFVIVNNKDKERNMQKHGKSEYNEGHMHITSLFFIL